MITVSTSILAMEDMKFDRSQPLQKYSGVENLEGKNQHDVNKILTFNLRNNKKYIFFCNTLFFKLYKLVSKTY